MPAIPNDNHNQHFFVILNKLGFSRNRKESLSPTSKTRSRHPFQIYVDSGSSFTYLPASFVRNFYLVLDIIMCEDKMCLECDTIPSDLTMDFTFKTTTIRIPIANMIWRPSEPLIQNGRTLCYFMVKQRNDPVTLGRYFLSNFYAVFDLDQHEISFAPLNRGAADSHIIEIPIKKKNLDSSSIPDPELSAENPAVSGSETSAENPSNEHSPTEHLASQSTNAESPGFTSADDSTSTDIHSVSQNPNTIAFADPSAAGNSGVSDLFIPTNPETSIFSDTPPQTEAEKPMSNENAEAAFTSLDQGSDPGQMSTGDQPVSVALTRRGRRSRRG